MPYEGTSQSIFQPYLKNMWHRGRVVDLTMRDKPLLAMMANPQDFFGEDQKVTVKHRNPQGRSANSVKAQANARSGRGARFSVTRVSNHQSVFVNNETIEASQNNMGALVKVVDDQVEGAVENLVNEIAWGLYRSGGGTRGIIASTTTPGGGAQDYVTLVTARDARAFEAGMTLKAGTTDGTTATTFRTTPSAPEITAVDRDLGRLYFAAGTFTGTNWAANDYLSVDGDIDESTFLGKYIKGLDAWVPLATPGLTDNFFGVNRGVDPTRLAGLRYDGRTKSPENAIIYAAADLRDAGGKPDACFLSSRQWTNIAVSLGTRVQYEELNGKGDTAALTFRSIVLPSDGGNVRLIGDPNCPDDVAWLLEMGSWSWHTLGEAPKVNLHNGANVLDPAIATDDVEIRWVYRGNVECNAPGHNMRVRLA